MSTGNQPQRAVRLIFEYDGDDVRLVSEHPVEMVVAETDAVRPRSPGYYVDARDAAGRTVARVEAHAAFAGSMEVFPERPDEPITRVDAPNRGAFTVVIPAPENADRVALVRVARGRAAASDARAQPGSQDVTDLASFPLRTNR
jgi:hypothetical protein